MPSLGGQDISTRPWVIDSSVILVSFSCWNDGVCAVFGEKGVSNVLIYIKITSFGPGLFCLFFESLVYLPKEYF